MKTEEAMHSEALCPDCGQEHEPQHTPGEWKFDPGERGYPPSRGPHGDPGDPGDEGYPPTVYVEHGEDEQIILAELREPIYCEEPKDEWDSGERFLGDVGANGKLMATAPAFFAACTQETCTAPALDWLGSLLAELRETGWAAAQEDAEASWTALTASEGLLEGLRAAAGVRG